MPNYYCEYCGAKRGNIESLTACSCQRHPLGAGKGKHQLYQGSEKAKYSCKYCGVSRLSIESLTSGGCQRHPSHPGQGKHAPAL